MGPTEWMRVEDFHSTLKVNTNGMIGMTMTFLPLIKKARGRIVNVSSVLGRVAANGGGYCISKYAVECFSDCLRYVLPLKPDIPDLDTLYNTCLKQKLPIIKTFRKA